MSDARVLDAAFEAVSWQMAVLDDSGGIVRVNRAWREFGRENDAPEDPEVSAVGANYLETCRATPGSESFSGRRAAEGIEEVLAGERQEFRMEYPCHAPDRRRWFLMSVRPLGSPEGGAVVSHIEITERKRTEDRLAHEALHDPLTDLANRRLFMDRLQQALARQARRQGRTAVAYLDLDGFKRINDRHGHEAGDDVLRRVARCIDAAVREGDTPARLGGDEFAVVLDDVAGPDVAEEAVRRVVERIDRLDRLGDLRLEVSASAGIAVADRPDVDPEELLRRADRAMYRAKEAGMRTATADDRASGTSG